MSERSRGRRDTLALQRILTDVRAQRRLTGKMSVLARYWHHIRGMPPSEREQVMAALGSQAAWRRLEAHFRRDGVLSESERSVKKTLDRVAAEPARVREVVRQARSGDYRGAAAGAVEILSAEPSAEDAEPAGSGADEVAAQGSEGSRTAGSEPAGSDPDASDPAEPSDVAESLDRVGGDAAAEPELAESESAGLESEAESEPEPQMESEAESEPEPQMESGAESEPEPQMGSGAGMEDEIASEPEPAPEREAASVGPTGSDNHPDREPSGRLTSAADRMAALRTLRKGGGASGGAAERARLLARLGPGWASRRGLTEMIRSLALDSLDEALGLIATLDTDAQRAWCLGDLVQHWPLDDDEIERLLDAAPTAAARRRLQRRVERGAA